MRDREGREKGKEGQRGRGWKSKGDGRGRGKVCGVAAEGWGAEALTVTDECEQLVRDVGEVQEARHLDEVLFVRVGRDRLQLPPRVLSCSGKKLPLCARGEGVSHTTDGL